VVVVVGGIRVATFTVAAIPFGVVGLSRGVTIQIGQSDQVVSMMLGRIGPIALGDFLLVPRNRTTHYPRGRIYLG
jgi:trk system potassium uptake protein TrkH